MRLALSTSSRAMLLLGALLGALLMLLLAVPRSMATTALLWSDPLPISELDGEEVTIAGVPALAVDHYGTLHTVWHSVKLDMREGEEERQGGVEGPAYHDLLIYRARIGDVWSTSSIIFQHERPPLGDAASPLSGGAGMYNAAFELRGQLLAERDSQLHLLVGNTGRQWFLTAPLDDLVRRLLLFPPWPLSHGPHSHMAVAHDGTLHMVMNEIPPGIEMVAQALGDDPDRKICLDCTYVFYRRSEDGGNIWLFTENISEDESYAVHPQIALDDRQRMHIIWEDRAEAQDPGGKLVYRFSDDGAANWSTPHMLGQLEEPVTQAVLGLNQANTVMLVYRGTRSNSVFYQFSTDGGSTWSAPRVMQHVQARGARQALYPRFSLAADSNGQMHLLMVGLQTGSGSTTAQLLHLRWDGQRWSAAVPLETGADNPLSPQLVLERGNRLHALWFTSNFHPVSRAEQQLVWYSTAQLAAPEQAPAPTFTPYPERLPTATPEPVILPTPTPLADQLVALEALDGPPLWELRGLQGVGVGLLSAALLLSFVGMVYLRLRR